MNGVTVKEEEDDLDYIPATPHPKPPTPTPRTPVVVTGGASNKIPHRLSGNSRPSATSPSSTNKNEEPSFDEVSQKGQFGWTVIGQTYLPYIFRRETKYCSVRMLEMKVLYKYVNAFKWDFYNCVCVKSYYVTEAEAKLLNEINFVHCNSLYGAENFNGNDLIVNLSDAHEFYQFLENCSLKLNNAATVKKCGFIRINNESVVPYTEYKGMKLVPLFYFEGETESLKGKSLKLKGWPLSYLKFCCKVQGIRNELFVHDSCTVVSVDDIKNHFPPGSIFQDYWPAKTALLMSNNGKADFKYGKWAKEPVTPPIFSNVNNLNHQNNNYAAAHAAIPSTAVQNVAPTTNYVMQHTQQHRNIVPRGDVNGYATNHMPISHHNTQQQQQQQQHHQHHQQQQSPTSMPNYRTDHGAPYVDPRKLILIPDPPTPDQSTAYQLQKVVFENRTVACISMKPHIATDMLLTLMELHEKFFLKNTDFQSLYRVVQVLGIPLYKANNSQTRVYVQYGKSANLNDVIPLIRVRDAMTYMPQLKYMLNGQISL